jgi:hypothetical protein
MMKRMRKSQDSDSSDEDDSSSDEESHSTVQVGYQLLLVHKKDLLKETLVRFSQSMLDLSVSPTSIFHLSSTTFITEDTPYHKYHQLVSDEFISFFSDDICPN